MDKNALRQKLKQQLVQMSREEIASQSKHICEYVMESDVFRKASVVMAFLSMPHEVDTTPLILTAWQRGKTVAVPKISWQQRHMIPVEINSLETGLKTDEHGLRNPTGGVPVPFDEIDLVITPGLGFDAAGNRLGRGGSYYDTFFTSNKIKAARWALAFSHQVCDHIPHDDSDVPVDAVVTENGIIVCKRP
jgi:5-formyltetrahydrofolate cyclo-ligase